MASIPRLLLVTLLLSSLPAFAESRDPEKAGADGGDCSLGSLAWLTGSWVANRDERRIEEHWLPPAGSILFGINRTIEGPETTSWELLRIECLEGRPTYLASPGGRQPPTPFSLDPEASDLDRYLLFRNPEHDYPQRIEYVRESEDRLVARISGGLGTAVLSWTFRRAAD